MECTDWTCWPGWVGVGGVAQVLSLIAIVIAVLEVVRRRRRVRAVVWGFDLFGSMNANDHRFHVGELSNGGTGTATIIACEFVGARPVQVGDYRYQSIVGPAERVGIPLSSAEIEHAWLFIVWYEDIDQNLVKFEWLPVAEAGAMRDALDSAIDRTRALGRFRDLTASRRARPVGPMYYRRASHRWTPDSERSRKLWARSWNGLPETGRFPWSFGDSVGDLPYVEWGAD